MNFNLYIKEVVNKTQNIIINKSEGYEKMKFRMAVIISSVFILFLWLIKIFEVYTKIELSFLGVYPKSVFGLKGILFAPLIHSGFSHLITNSITLFVIMIFLFYAYTNSAIKVFPIIYIVSNLFVWSFGREAYHIGASGLVYGIISYLFFVGIFRRDTKSIALSLLVTFLYGGLVWGIFPGSPEISYESHLGGALTGAVCSFFFRNSDPRPEKYEWEYEDDEDDDYEYIPAEEESAKK